MLSIKKNTIKSIIYVDMGTFIIGIILFRKIDIQKLKHFKNSNSFETLNGSI